MGNGKSPRTKCTLFLEPSMCTHELLETHRNPELAIRTKRTLFCVISTFKGVTKWCFNSSHTMYQNLPTPLIYCTNISRGPAWLSGKVFDS